MPPPPRSDGRRRHHHVCPQRRHRRRRIIPAETLCELSLWLRRVDLERLRLVCRRYAALVANDSRFATPSPLMLQFYHYTHASYGVRSMYGGGLGAALERRLPSRLDEAAPLLRSSFMRCLLTRIAGPNQNQYDEADAKQYELLKSLRHLWAGYRLTLHDLRPTSAEWLARVVSELGADECAHVTLEFMSRGCHNADDRISVDTALALLRRCASVCVVSATSAAQLALEPSALLEFLHAPIAPASNNNAAAASKQFTADGMVRVDWPKLVALAQERFADANDGAHSYTLHIANANPSPQLTAFHVDNAVREERLELEQHLGADAANGNTIRWVLRRSRVAV